MNYRRKKNIIILTILLFSSSMLFLIFYLLSATKSKGNLILSALNYVVDCCVLFFSKISAFIIFEKVFLAYAGLAFLIYGVIEALRRLFTTIGNTKELFSNLEIVKKFKHKGNIQVNVFKADRILTAFTMGFLKPEIFISSKMFKTFTQEELDSVIAHEEHHVIERDPLKVVVLRFIGEVFFFIPLIKYLLRKFEEAMEKSADDNARRQGIDELALASALLKVQKSNGLLVPVASFVELDTKGLVESRVIRLLQPEKEKLNSIPKKIISTTAFLYLILLISAFSLPEKLQKMPGTCIHSPAHSSCTQMSPEECKKHCEEIRAGKKE